MKIKTSRFGELEANKEDILDFPEGVLGFEQLRKFFIVDPGDNTLILWLQSIEDGTIAFPAIEPKIFKPDYTAKLMNTDLNGLELENEQSAKIYCILTIPSDITQMSANLKAPVVINSAKKIAKQIVLQDNKLTVKHEMYKDLKKYIVSYSSSDQNRTTVANTENGNDAQASAGNPANSRKPEATN